MTGKKITRRKKTIFDQILSNKAFTDLKSCLARFPILSLPDFHRPFFLISDGSNIGTSCILAKNMRVLSTPVHFQSKQMEDEQCRWHSYEIEALVFAQGLRAFKHFLGDEVKCLTDCRALFYIVQKKRYPRSWRDTYQLNIGLEKN
jgi:hypothetical protein